MANINFEDILPWGTTGGDTGLSARLKLKRNFDKIKTWIETGLSEYAKKNEVMTLEQADLRYLSKTVADVAAGHITFEQGLCSILTATFGDYKRVARGDNTNTGAAVTGDGTGDFLNLRVLQKVLGNLSVEQTIDAINMIFSGVLKSVGADPSFENGTGIYMDATTGKGSFDGLEVRGFMRVMELIINRLQLMESDYSFTEGDTVEHIGYENNGQTMVLTMKKDHDNDYTPFYPGDIIYAKVNDLLPRDGSVPNGHTATKNGSYYTSWMRVKSVDFTNNQLRVELYAGKNQDNSPRVPGGINFSPHGTALADANIATEMQAEYNEQPDGYDTIITVTRHGNVGDGIDPDTGLPSASILQSQQGRQQSWHLSTTDQRIIYYWRVDSPIVSDTNIALCLGMLPRSLSSVVPTTIDWAKPSLFISQVYYETMTQVRYPAKVVKEDRGAWRAQPTATYEGIAGTWTPDGSFADMNGETWGAGSTGTKYGTQAAKYATIVGNSITVADGDIIPEPYHCRTFTLKQWLNDRLDDTRVSGWSDGRMEMMMMLDWKRDLEVSRVWHHGILWECLVDGTTEEPGYGCTDWQPISGETTLRMNIIGVNGNILGDSLSVIRGMVNETLRGLVMWGQEDVSAKVGAWSWDIIEAGGTVTSNTSNQRQIIVTDSSLPASWTSQGFVTLRANAMIGSETLTASIKLVNGDISSYEVEFSGYVDVITVDDVGNCIGGLYTVDSDSSSEEGEEYRDYRIHSAITVRRNGALLICDESDSDSSSDEEEETPAATGTYKIYAEPHGCQCVIENSTIYITHIDNIKDGVAGTADDANFDYDAMRRMESCSVDLLIDCEGVGTIQKNFPVTIKHDSQPYVGADLTNPFSAVSWNTRTQQYIGLPITFDMKMWHNNQPLDILNTSDVSLTGVVTGMTVVKSIQTITKNQGTANEYSFKVARISITALPANLPPVTEIGVTCSAQYSGVRYERTLTHTINKQTDVNVYSLHPSADEVVIGAGGVLNPSSLTCSIYCDSSEHKHYGVPVEPNGKNTAHKIYLCWKKEYTDGTSDANYTAYTGAVAVDSSVRRVIFSLFGLTDGNPDVNIFHDSEDVPVIAAGVDGKSIEFVYFRQNTPSPKPTLYDDSADNTTDNGQTKTRAQLFQEDDYCPYTDQQHSDRWTDEPQEVGDNARYEFYAQRKKVNGVWQPFGDVLYWNHKAIDGQSSYIIDLTNENSFVACETDGTPIAGAAYESSDVLIFLGLTDKLADFNIKVVPTNISCNGYYPNGGTAVSGQQECPEGGFTLNSPYTLQPSNILTGAATIAVRATHKNNSSIVLVATYKVNKNIAGQTGVIYSLQPSLNVIKKNTDGTFRDTTLGVEVKKTRGVSTELLSTYKAIADEGLVLTYENNHTNSPFTLVAAGATSTDTVSLSTATFVNNSGTWGKLVLKKSNTVHDTERINVIMDGKDGEDGEDGQDGADGEDGIGISSIATSYAVSAYETNYNNDETNPPSDLRPYNSSQWSASSPQATAAKPYLWRREHTDFTDENSTTKYYCVGKLGTDGIDGPGSEWVYIRTKTNTPPSLMNDSGHTDSNSHSYTDEDYLPRVDGTGRNTANAIDIEMNGGASYSYPECSDDPQGVSETWPYEWEAKRMKVLNQAGTAREWQKYYDAMADGNTHLMSLHAKWSKDGEDGQDGVDGQDGQDGADGQDGVSQPSYLYTQEKWSNDTTVTAALTNDTGWSDSTPANPNSLLYLWRRSRLMVLNETTREYEPEANSDWTYVRLNGTNGTSIEVKGNVATTSQLGNGIVYPYINGATSQTAVSVSDGWTYKCIADNHLYMWSAESGSWIDLGQFKGEDGETWYTHIAWASDVTLSTSQLSIPTGQKTRPNATSVTGFDDKPFTGAKFMGVLIDLLPTDSQTGTDYTWNEVKGEQGPAGQDGQDGQDGQPGQDGKDGEDGADGQSSFKSTIFTRTNSTPDAPADSSSQPYGSFAVPSPPTDSSWAVRVSGSALSGVYWHDAIPDGEETLWATTRTFTSDGQSPQDAAWSTPRKMTDTETYDVEFAKMQANDAAPATPTDSNRHGGSGTQVWFDPVLDSSEDFTQMYWRAERTKKNGTWGSWTIVRIKGEQGPQGQASVMYWIEANPSLVHYNPNTDTCSPANIGLKVHRVEGETDTVLTWADMSTYGLTLQQSTNGGNWGNVAQGDFNAYYYGTVQAATWAINGYEIRNFKLIDSTTSAVYATAAIGVASDGEDGTNGTNGQDGEDGEDGAPGATGRMFRFRGKYVSGTEYIANDSFVDVVFFDDGYHSETGKYGQYFYINYGSASTNKSGITYYAPANADRLGNSYDYTSGIWVAAADFGLIITDGIFADFAKLGSAIMSGDYMFSMNGYVNGVAKNNGAMMGTPATPAYTRFMGDPTKLGGTFTRSYITDSPYSGSKDTLAAKVVQKGVTISVTVTGKATTGTLYVEILDSSGSRLKYMSFGSTEQTQTISYESPADGTYYVKAYCDAGNRTASLSGTYSFSGYFEPNWWVDLKTGKMSAAKGNFVVDANGDVDVKGTVKATNLFRTLTLTSGNGAGNQGEFGGANNDTPCNIRSVTLNPDGSQATWIYFRQAATVNGVTFQQGKYYTSAEVEAANDINSYYALDWKNDPDKCSVCTGPADEVMLIDNFTAPLQVGGVVLLPRCEDFAGKTVVVRHTTSNGNNSVNIYQCDYASNKFYGTGQMNGWAYYEASQSEAYFSIEKGQTVTFYSTGTKWLVVAKS